MNWELLQQEGPGRLSIKERHRLCLRRIDHLEKQLQSVIRDLIKVQNENDRLRERLKETA